MRADLGQLLHADRGGGRLASDLRPQARGRAARARPHHPLHGLQRQHPRHAHCDDVGHVLENGHCVATIHAEANAILQAARNGVRIEGADIYTTASPCWPCFKMIANAGIKRIVYGEFYRDERIFEWQGRWASSWWIFPHSALKSRLYAYNRIFDSPLTPANA